MWRSTDSGSTWSSDLVGAPYGYWSGIAGAQDSSLLVAVQDMDASGMPGSVYISQDFGGNWTKDTILPPAHWAGVAVATDGSTILVTPGQNTSAGMFLGSFRAIPPIGIAVAAAAAVGVAAGVGIGKK